MTHQSRAGKKNKFTITASEEGVEIAEKALIRLGFESKSNFAKSQLISRSVVTKFFNHQPIQLDTFKRICDALKLNWREVAGLEDEQQSTQVKRLDCSSLETQEGVKPVQTLHRLVTIVDEPNQTVKAEIILKGDINSVDNLKTLELILRQYSGHSIKIKDIEEGSIKLKIEGSEEDINRLVEQIKSGELTEVNGFPIEDIKILSESSDDEESDKPVDKWRLVEEIVSQTVENRDLRGVDLSDADLSRADLSEADLSEADLSEANLSAASLSLADLSGADLSGADLSEADLSAAYLYEADLSGADLTRANLYGADLIQANLIRSNLIRANFYEANLIRANLYGADLRSADLRSADLRNADLRSANFYGANLCGANLCGANLYEANLYEANLYEADLYEADLSKSRVTNTKFSSNSLGMTEELKRDLIERGAMTKEIFPENQGTFGSTTQEFDQHAWKESKSNFEAEFLELLNPESSDGRLIFAFFRARLKQFHLEKVYSEGSVLNEVYLRAIDKIQEGAVIRIPHAWIRATGYNYIRELSRQQQKSIQQEDYHLEINPEEDKQILNLMALKEELAAEQRLIRKAFEMLMDVERQLLHLKIVEGLSWKEIQQQHEFTDCSLPTLRKRKQRVLKKLHTLYHTLKNS